MDDAARVSALVAAADEAATALPVLAAERGQACLADFERRKGPGAVAVFARMAALEAPPDATRAVVRLLAAAFYVRRGDLEQATHWCREHVALAPWDPSVRADLLGVLDAQASDTAGAYLATRRRTFDDVRDLVASCLLLSTREVATSLQHVARRPVGAWNPVLDAFSRGEVAEIPAGAGPREVLAVLRITGPDAAVVARLEASAGAPLSALVHHPDSTDAHHVALRLAGASEAAVRSSLDAQSPVPPPWLTFCNRAIATHAAGALLALELEPTFRTVLR
ncbi:MAG: hypothetical protein H6737_27455 [Alphaproteobacteria bacterium]|nr:hypothetical protein [Alphaproteobacteria bacterium]